MTLEEMDPEDRKREFSALLRQAADVVDDTPARQLSYDVLEPVMGALLVFGLRIALRIYTRDVAS